MDDLAKLAERQNTVITHMALNFLHYYMVQSNGVIYRYVISTGQKGMVEMEQPALPQLYPLNNIENDYIDADPIGDDQYRYRVNINQNRHAQTEPDQTVLLHRIKL